MYPTLLDDPKEQYYCPICGKLDPLLVFFKHRCSPEDLARIDRQTEQELEPAYGEQIADGFAAVNPYDDCDY